MRSMPSSGTWNKSNEKNGMSKNLITNYDIIKSMQSIHLLGFILIAVMGIIPIFDLAYGQTIIVNSTAPCFLNSSAGIDLWRQCGADEDWVAMALLPFEWITGGFFSLILASLIILGVYLKYHKVIYAFAVGMVFIPISFQFFPDQFLSFAAIAAFLGLTATVYYLIRDQIR